MNTQAEASRLAIIKRHGGAADRGSADAYYGRPCRPHYYRDGTYTSGRVDEAQMTPDEIAAYKAAYASEDDRKDWGV